MIPKYMLAAVDVLEEVTSFRGKDVLEIGGTMNLDIPRIMRERGANSVTVTNISHGIRKAVEGGIGGDGITVQYADALALEDHFPERSFDIVFGTAVLEHIPDPARLLASIDYVLKPGGSVFLSGGPLWSSAQGHHVWVNTDNGMVRFSDDSCPIPDWSHLVLSPSEMTDYLNSLSTFSAADVEKMVHWIYQSENLNRITDQDIQNAIQSSRMKVLKAKKSKFTPESTYFDRASELASNSYDITVANLHYVLRKGGFLSRFSNLFRRQPA